MSYLVHLSTLITIYAILGLGLNLVLGYTGLPSLAQAAFYGIGAYTTAILSTHFGLNFFLTVPIGIIHAMIIAGFIGLILSKFRDDYYLLISLGFNVIVYGLFRNLNSLTNGPLGIAGIKKPKLPGLDVITNSQFLIICLIFLAIIYLIARFIDRSSFGRVLKAIREDETALQVFGYKTSYYKLVIFIIAAAMSAVAGSLFASYLSFIDPGSFTLMESVFILTIIIFGGLGSLPGGLAGAICLLLIPELLRFIGFPLNVAAHLRQLVYGLILILIMRYRPKGLFGNYKI